jgi:hypothetical protein
VLRSDRRCDLNMVGPHNVMQETIIQIDVLPDSPGVGLANMQEELIMSSCNEKRQVALRDILASEHRL